MCRSYRGSEWHAIRPQKFFEKIAFYMFGLNRMQTIEKWLYKANFCSKLFMVHNTSQGLDKNRFMIYASTFSF